MMLTYRYSDLYYFTGDSSDVNILVYDNAAVHEQATDGSEEESSEHVQRSLHHYLHFSNTYLKQRKFVNLILGTS